MSERNYLQVVLFGGRFDGPTDIAWRADVLPEKLWAYMCKDGSDPGCTISAPHRPHVDVTAIEGVEDEEAYEKIGLDEGNVYYKREGLPFDPRGVVPEKVTTDASEPLVTA